MWRYFRKRRALRAYRTTLFRQLRDTYGRKLYYSADEVKATVRDLRGAAEAFDCYALAMFCERDAFDAYHAAHGETCDYDAMRTEVFAHVATVSISAPEASQLDGGCSSSHHHSAADTHHDVGHHDVGHHHIADSFDGGGGFDGGSHH